MSTKGYTISINPSYFCNFRCNFCYLTETQLSDTKKISLERLDELLGQVPKIDYIDLYGGEIGALKKSYFYGMKDTIRKHYDGEINIITNYSMLHEGFYDDDVSLSVSYDFEAREKSDLVFRNMLLSPVPIAVLILASKNVLQKDVEEMIGLLNMCSAITSVEIKPYSINQANADNVTHKDYEDFVKKWLEAKTEKLFQFINEEKIQASLAKEYNAFSDDHIYITPNGKFGVLEFDGEDREYFLELDSWDDYLEWTRKEKETISPLCKQCPYFGNCLTEHYRYVESLENGCNGYRGLLEYYEGMETETGSLS
jgi:sulfatase maturation enzyme AslB (radical SAM superfamily)